MTKQAKQKTTKKPIKKIKPQLKVEKQLVLKVDDDTLEKFIKKVTGKDFEFVADQECGNDSQHEFDVDGELDQYDKETMDEFFEDGVNHGYIVLPLLNWLAKERYIDKKTYLVSVCW